MTKGTDTPGSRADMIRSRRLLLAAATEAFAECGVDVSMSEIAQRAGVAKGTVFRHFASKDDLLAAIMLQLLDQLIGTADRLLEADDAGAALWEFMTTGVEVLAADRAFCELIGRPSLQHAEVRDAIDRLRGIIEDLTARAKEQGAVRGDVMGTDMVLLLGGIHQTALPLLDREPQVWRRYLALAFDGLRNPSARPCRIRRPPVYISRTPPYRPDMPFRARHGAVPNAARRRGAGRAGARTSGELLRHLTPGTMRPFLPLLTFSVCVRVVTLGDPCGMPVLCGTRMVGA
ncbi:TetR/AcrR family transcriptional regulator [Streptomyces sp. NPDC059866]|uniref:TetR/AcrR family transcriptional regulator n=1 Tax=Streptomyces sp. NPDC059866 TaxID=3346978 RepID=UPI003664CADC